jgi:hypothetical protein
MQYGRRRRTIVAKILTSTLAKSARESLLERIEKVARARGIAARKLIRAMLAERFGGEQGLQPIMGGGASSQQRLDQILFDLTRTRLILQHLLDNQVGSEITDRIRQTAQAEAERYTSVSAGETGHEFVANRDLI